MFQSDLEALFIGKEKHRQCLKISEDIKKMRLSKKASNRTHFRVRLGTQLIVLGTRLKGGKD